MIEVRGLTKHYGSKKAVDDVTFTVQPGRVTAFLGPNGAGKSTTMRLILGLDRPDAGSALVNGVPYEQLSSPLTQVGALLDAKAAHKGRSARSHLRAIAATHGFPRARVDEVIELTGLGPVAGKRVGGFSLGMGQRLGIAAALLGDPETLILDEPVNGLDPEGVAWVRTTCRHLAAQGRTVFLSSHLMSEVALTADDVVVIGRGRVLDISPVGDLVERFSSHVIRVRTPQAEALAAAVAQAGHAADRVEADVLHVHDMTSQEVGTLAASQQVVVYEISEERASLEDAYLKLTHGAVEYRTDPDATGGGPTPGQPPQAPPVPPSELGGGLQDGNAQQGGQK